MKDAGAALKECYQIWVLRLARILPGSFEHKVMPWYAEIIDRGNYSDVWMVGDGLKSSTGFPGGWVYESPIEIETEVIKSLSTPNK